MRKNTGKEVDMKKEYVGLNIVIVALSLAIIFNSCSISNLNKKLKSFESRVQKIENLVPISFKIER